MKFLLKLAACFFALSTAYGSDTTDFSAFGRLKNRIGKHHHLDATQDSRANTKPPRQDFTASSSKKFRFLSDATRPFQVKSLPDVLYDVGEMYSGLIPIDTKNKSRALFFVFQPTVGPSVDEVTIWLNGGPGCSSLWAFLLENGRFIWSPGVRSPELNPYSWVNLTNMLWVDQPVGTGFSTGEITATSQEEIAQNFVNWFKNFEKTFGIKKFKIYMGGESYAGRFVSYIAAAMIDKNDKNYYDLGGVILYDPTIGSNDYVQEIIVTVPFIHQNNNLLNFNSSFLAHLDALDVSCNFSSYRSQYFTFPPSGIQPPMRFDFNTMSDCDVLGQSYVPAWNINPCFNIYKISDTCPFLPDVLGFPATIRYQAPGVPIYFNRTDVKLAMHAPLDIDWQVCARHPVMLAPNSVTPEQDSGDRSAHPIQSTLPKVIDYTKRVLISNAALDMIIITNGTLLAIQNMTWGGKLGFQTRPNTSIVIDLPDLQYENVFEAAGLTGLDEPQGAMGVQHFERGLTWAETFASGHLQPANQPRSSYRHLQWMLGHIDSL